MPQNVAKTGCELTEVAKIGRSRSVYGQKRVEGGVGQSREPKFSIWCLRTSAHPFLAKNRPGDPVFGYNSTLYFLLFFFLTTFFLTHTHFFFSMSSLETFTIPYVCHRTMCIQPIKRSTKIRMRSLKCDGYSYKVPGIYLHLRQRISDNDIRYRIRYQALLDPLPRYVGYMQHGLFLGGQHFFTLFYLCRTTDLFTARYAMYKVWYWGRTVVLD